MPIEIAAAIRAAKQSNNELSWQSGDLDAAGKCREQPRCRPGPR
ncbi:hypothetical protein [Nocardia mexicana]|nr:hypothetical protein [Nocardia mexicana]